MKEWLLNISHDMTVLLLLDFMYSGGHSSPKVMVFGDSNATAVVANNAILMIGPIGYHDCGGIHVKIVFWCISQVL